MARIKNRIALTASPARHFSPPSSCSTPAFLQRKKISFVLFWLSRRNTYQLRIRRQFQAPVQCIEGKLWVSIQNGGETANFWLRVNELTACCLPFFLDLFFALLSSLRRGFPFGILNCELRNLCLLVRTSKPSMITLIRAYCSFRHHLSEAVQISAQSYRRWPTIGLGQSLDPKTQPYDSTTFTPLCIRVAFHAFLILLQC